MKKKKDAVKIAKDADCTCSYGRGGQKYKSGHGHSMECARFAYEDWNYWKRGARNARIARRELPVRGTTSPAGKQPGTRGRKRAEDVLVRFLKSGEVVVSVPGRTPLVSRRVDPIGSTVWFLLHMLGLTAYDDEDFLISAQRTKP